MNDFLTIENRSGKLTLNDVVHKDSADKLIDELGKLYGPSAVAAQMSIGDIVCKADDALESVEVEINSPGGSVMEGQRIYNALRGMSARGVAITTTVNGRAASMGSVIMLAGDTRQMTRGSRIMIHEASMVSWGDARTLRKNADLLEGISSEIATLYSDRTGGDKDEIRQLMYAETWMDADKAKALGFATVIIKDGKAEKEAKAEFDTEPKIMSIFAKLFPGNDEALKIEASLLENDSLRSDLESAQARIVELTGLSEVNAQLQTELSEVQAKVATFETQATADAEKITELTAANEVTEDKIAARASELLAAQGHKAPVNLIGESNMPESKTLAREAFNALSPSARLAFVKTGGKLS
jgi:ATP-dependent protease ClpP protease subunit